jgi:hypothetical protein
MINMNKCIISNHSNVLNIFKTQINVFNLIANVQQPFKEKKPTSNSIVDLFYSGVEFFTQNNLTFL